MTKNVRSDPFARRPTGALLRLAHQRSRAAANHRLRALEVDLRHVGVLAALATGGPLTQRRLSDVVELDRSSMVYVVDRLEELGLVRRLPSPADRRAYAVTITEEGSTRLREASAVAMGVMEELLEGFEPAEITMLDDLLRRIIDRSAVDRSSPNGSRSRAPRSLVSG
jgi:DNA-binding MarR family transcriptional regulator